MPDSTTESSQIVQHRLPAEGADQLILAGVNDANLSELAEVCGCRVVLRDDHVVLSGSLAEVEHCSPIARRMIDLARLGTPFPASDVRRFADVVESSEDVAPSALDESKIILPGSRKIITPKSAGQKAYIDEMARNDIVISIGPHHDLFAVDRAQQIAQPVDEIGGHARVAGEHVRNVSELRESRCR